VPIDFNELRELLRAIAQTDISEFTLKSESFELVVRKNSAPTPAIAEIALPAIAAGAAEKVAVASPAPISAVPPPPAAATAPEPTAAAINKKWVPIASPMVGTFYRASAPGEAPFVEVNDRVSQGQAVCIIEAMKLMNEIEAELSGQVREIAVANGEPVEYGQTLMWIDPS
jgi:acetyl-CoA carboxylase biotin carboxyl carrier protein